MYGPTKEAKILHRNTIVDGEHVGIGGALELDNGAKIPEATPAQYKQIFERGGHGHLIEHRGKKKSGQDVPDPQMSEQPQGSGETPVEKEPTENNLSS